MEDLMYFERLEGIYENIHQIPTTYKNYNICEWVKKQKHRVEHINDEIELIREEAEGKMVKEMERNKLEIMKI